MTNHVEERAVPAGPPRRRRDVQMAILYGWMLVLSLMVTFVGVKLLLYIRHTSHIAQTNCHHSKVLAPALGAGFLRTGILTEGQLKAFKATLPTSC